MSAAATPVYRIYLIAPIDRRLGLRLDDAVDLGAYEPDDPAWLPAVGETVTLQGANFKIALPGQANDDPSANAGDIYVEPA